MASERRLVDANVLEEMVKISDKPAWMVVRDAPTVDAVEVVHGRWEKASEIMPIYRCSICKERNLFKNGYNVFSNYCPNCGAKMDGERKMVNLEDIVDLDAQAKANNEAMRKVIDFITGERTDNNG